MTRIKLLLLTVVLLFATGCSDKEKAEGRTVQTQQQKIAGCEANKTADTNETNGSKTSDCNLSKIGTMLEGTSILRSFSQETHGVTVDGNRFIINDVKQPIVLVNFFSTWCPPCRAQIPYFEDLRKKHGKELFITGILVNDDANATKLKQFSKKYDANYFISSDEENQYVAAKVVEALKLDENFTLPLTVLYRNGEYYTHYEGPVPVEMIDLDIRMAVEEK